MTPRGYSSSTRTRLAALTRREILKAAETLFTRHGYVRTTVAAIAEEAEVAVNTVYASVGGKLAVLLALTQAGASDEVAAQALDRIEDSDSAAEILRLLAVGTGWTRARQQSLLAILFDNRNVHPDVSAAAEHAEQLLRERLGRVAARLLAVGGLRAGLSRADLDRALWFYFGFTAWRTVRDLGLSWDDGARWLIGQAGDSLLANPPG